MISDCKSEELYTLINIFSMLLYSCALRVLGHSANIVSKHVITGIFNVY